MPPILTGLRVVELAHMIAAPVCGQILASLGAEVTKVEPPEGDITRRLGPRWQDTSALFGATNAGKRSLRADVRDPESGTRVRALALAADVVICNLDRAAVAPAGLDAASLRGENPALVYVEVSAFGAEGPPGTDGLAQAAMGLMNITGAEDGPSYRTGASVIDVSTGVFAALGVLAALERRRQTGRGDTLNVSLGDVCLFLQFGHLGMHAAAPERIRRSGNHSHVACTPTFTASDGNVLTTLLHDRHWSIFCGVVGAPELLRDPRFLTNEQRCGEQGTLEALLNPVFARGTRAEWVARLREARIPCAPERAYAEVCADDALHRSGALYELSAGGRDTLAVRLPLRFGEGELVPLTAAPD